MKIALITIVDKKNYGNRLQNYAIQKIIQEMGHDCVTIQYQSYHSYKSFVRHKLFKRKRCIINDEHINAFNRFNSKYINMSDDIENALWTSWKFKTSYDAYIVGSDQVWNPYYDLGINLFMLSNVRNYKKISLAASIGVSELPEEKKRLYKTRISRFAHLSVREESAKTLLQDLFADKKIEVLIDPTLALNISDWVKFEKKPSTIPKQKYVVKYILGKTEEKQNKDYNEFILKNKYQSVELYNKDIEEWYDIDPCEFLWLIHHAEMVITDSFHASVFAIRYNIPFVVVKRYTTSSKYGMESRFDELFKNTGIEPRYYDNGGFEKYLFTPDFDEDNVFKEKQKRFFDYIQNCLNDIMDSVK